MSHDHFTRFRCGKCGTLIIGQEKYKKQKDGSFKRHVYYTCTSRTKRACKQPYINEVNMCLILKEFIENNHKRLNLSDELTAIVTQHQEASNTLMRHYDIDQKLEHPIVEYARYVLTKGLDNEKHQLIIGINNALEIKGTVIRISELVLCE